MPVKKGKGKGKKGKGKKGKGKKGKKKSSAKAKVDPSGLSKEALVETKVWESRLASTEAARQEFRVVARQLAADNASVVDQLRQSEKDTLEVVAFLKRESQAKDEQIIKLQQQVKDLRRETRKEHEILVNEFSQQINNLEDELSQKRDEIEVMSSELKLVKEFRKKRALMQRELDELKESKDTAEIEHQQEVSQMDRKHIEEKSRLQKEADRKVTELAQEAHKHAMSKLNDTSKDVFRENIRLKDALKLHMDEGQRLKVDSAKLTEQNHHLKQAQETDRLVHEERASQAMRLKKQNSQLLDKIYSLEKALSNTVREQGAATETLQKENERTLEAMRSDNMALKQTLILKGQEMNKVKLVAKRILDQRATVEEFFLSALADVRTNLADQRKKYYREAKAAYDMKVRAAMLRQGSFPPVRTFNKSGTSTNSMLKDAKSGEGWPDDISRGVDIGDLTWEQKEQVLRLLFSKMNQTNTTTADAAAVMRAKQPTAVELPQIAASAHTPQHVRTGRPRSGRTADSMSGGVLAITDGNEYADSARSTASVASAASGGVRNGAAMSLALGSLTRTDATGGARLSTEVDLS